MLTYLAIALGGAIGSGLRYWLNLAVTARAGEAMPWGTIVINVSGSFVIGMVSAMTAPGGRLDWPVEARLFVLVGLCGGYTTFSSFSLQTLALFEAGHPLRAIANVLLSVTLCLLAVWLGYSGHVLLHRSGRT